jgi:membrane protein
VPPDPQHGLWEERLAHVLLVAPPRLRPSIAWLARNWVGRLVGRTAAGLVRVQIFDRSMTLAAQAFTSIFPVLILLAAVLGKGQGERLADIAHLPPTSRYVIDDALSHGGLGAFGVVGSLVVVISSTGLARALGRAYAAVWSVYQTPGGPRASWRWLVIVMTLALFAVGSRVLGWFSGELPLRGLVSALLLLVIDCSIALFVPWLLLGHAVPTRMLLPGSILFGLAMLFVRPAGAVYLPRALQTSADRYGTIGVAFTYIGWLYVVAFCVMLAAIFGYVIANDEGPLGRLIRRTRPDRPDGVF